MKTILTKSLDPFQEQLMELKMLIVASKMAKVSSILLSSLSLILMFYSKNNILVTSSLLIGIAVLGIYMFKFLPLKNIIR